MALSKSTQDENPYDIGQVFLDARQDGKRHVGMFNTGALINPYTVGQSIETPFNRHIYPSEKDKNALKKRAIKEKDARKSLDKFYATQFPCKYYKKYDPDTFQKLSHEDKM